MTEHWSFFEVLIFLLVGLDPGASLRFISPAFILLGHFVCGVEMLGLRWLLSLCFDGLCLFWLDMVSGTRPPGTTLPSLLTSRACPRSSTMWLGGTSTYRI